jgi:hypothetical protein
VATEYDLIVAGDGVHEVSLKEFRDRMEVTAEGPANPWPAMLRRT